MRSLSNGEKLLSVASLSRMTLELPLRKTQSMLGYRLLREVFLGKPSLSEIVLSWSTLPSGTELLSGMVPPSRTKLLKRIKLLNRADSKYGR